MSKPITNQTNSSHSSSPSLSISSHSYESNSTTPLSERSTSSSLTHSSSLSLSTSSYTQASSFGAQSRPISASTSVARSPLASHTPSSHSASSSLPRRQVSSDQSIIIESPASSNPASASATQPTGSKLSRLAKKAKDKFISIFKSATPQKNALPLRLNTLILSEKWMSKSADWKLLKDDHLFHISLFLSPEEVAIASTVCKSWKQSLDKQTVWKKQQEIQGYAPIHPEIEKCLKGFEGSRFSSNILTIIAEYDEPRVWDYKAVFKQPISNAINPSDYATHFRRVRVVDPKPRPSKMRWENNQSDPDHPGKTIGETHIWTYRPRLQINGNVTTLTINILNRLVRNPLLGHPTKIAFSPGATGFFAPGAISQKQRNLSMGDDEWYLMPKTVFKETRDSSFRRQVQIVKAKGYEIPSGPDIILTALVWHVLTGEYLFGQDPLTYTNTTSLTANGYSRWIIGDFGPDGLTVFVNNDHDFGFDAYGLVGLRKFSLKVIGT